MCIKLKFTYREELNFKLEFKVLIIQANMKLRNIIAQSLFFHSI